jgi:hypothetical protein
MAAQDRTPDSDARGLLGSLLRLARLEAGVATQVELGRLLQVDQSGITRAETGNRLPNSELMEEWLAQCSVGGLARKAIEGIWLLAKTWGDPSRARTQPWFETEAAAHTLRYWQPTIVPGLFQTADYARALFQAMGKEAETVNQDVDARMARQSVFERTVLPTVIVVLDETVLRRLIGSPQVMQKQCARLLELSERVVVQVVPSEIGANPGLGGPLSLAAADELPELLLTGGLVEDQVTNNVGRVRQASATFDSVRAEALPRGASRQRISEAMETWGRQETAGESPVTAATAAQLTA